MSETTTPPAATTPASWTSGLRIYASIAGGFISDVASSAVAKVRKWSMGAQLAVAAIVIAFPLWAYEGFSFPTFETASSVDHKIAIAADVQRTDFSKMIEDQRADIARSIAETTPGKKEFAGATAAIADLSKRVKALEDQASRPPPKGKSKSRRK